MKRELINQNWRVWKNTNPFELVFHVPEDAVSVSLPYDAMFHEAQTENSVNRGSTGFLDGGEYKYYRRLQIPGEYQGERIALHFEGIYRNAAIFVNQSQVAYCANGYTHFTADITDYVRFGEENELLVTVNCGTRNSRWYSGAGIFRNVWLLHGPALHIAPDTLRFTTISAESESPDGSGSALVEIEASICNDRNEPVNIQATITLRKENAEAALVRRYPIRIGSHTTLQFRKRIRVEQAKLWDASHPALYEVQLQICDDKEPATEDSERIVTGIRRLELDSGSGLRVNGKKVKLRGACTHHDQFLLGAETYYDYEYRRVRRLKEAGFNAVRSAHNPASQQLLEACDRLGVYVMDELTDVWEKSKTVYDYSNDFSRDWEKDVRCMVASDYNHPSVLLYSTGNEIFEIGTEKGIETSRALGELFHRLDPTRYTTNGINGAIAAGDGLAQIVSDLTDGKANTGKVDVNVFMGLMEHNMGGIVTHPIIGDLLERLETTMDVLGYNYMTQRYAGDTKAYPDRVMVGTETYPKQIAENWREIMDSEAVIGDFTWTGWDYLGEVEPVFPALQNLVGDISGIGLRRPVSFYREIVFGLKKGPCIAVQNPESFDRPRQFGPWCYTDCTFCYTYDGQEGKPIFIQVYAGGDEVELFQNGKSLGKKVCGKETDFEASYETVYEPGILEAVAREGGKEIGRSTLCTTGKASRIQIALEDGPKEQLLFLMVSLRDEQGRVDVTAENALEVFLSDGLKLEAFGSDRSRHDHGFSNSTTTAAEGHALLIVRKCTQNPETVRITGDGLEEANLVIA